MSDVYYLGYEFEKAFIQTTETIATTTATSVFTANSHGLANGTAVVLTDITGLSNVALSTTYFVVGTALNTFGIAATIGGTAIAVGTGAPNVIAINEVSFPWPNTASVTAENQTYTWEGGATTKTIELLRDLTLSFESAAVPASVHQALFSKPVITGDQPGDMSALVGYGGGDDIAGISAGLRLEGFAIKSTAGLESRVNFARWFPQGTLTLSSPGSIQTGQVFGNTVYSFSVSRTTVNIAGGTITSQPEFFFDGEVP
jgi:hypothetical protein